jgi:hypothetical protein
MDGNEIIIEQEDVFIVGRIDFPLPEILSWGFEKLKTANKQRKIRQILIRDPKTRQTYSVIPYREAARHCGDNSVASQLIDIADRRRRRS